MEMFITRTPVFHCHALSEKALKYFEILGFPPSNKIYYVNSSYFQHLLAMFKEFQGARKHFVPYIN